MKRITQFILCIVLAVSAYGQGVGGNSVPRTVSGISAALDLISSTQGTVFYRGASGWEALPPGTSGQLFSTQGAAANPIWVTATGGAGDVNGPTLGTATDNAIVRFDGTGGKTVQNSAVTIADTTGAMTWSGDATISGGSSGASLVLGSGASGDVSATRTGNSFFTTTLRNTTSGTSAAATLSLLGGTMQSYIHQLSEGYTTSGPYTAGSLVVQYPSAYNFIVTGGGTEAMRVTTSRTLLLGTTTQPASLTGGVSIVASGSGATATGVQTGGLQSANFGLSTVSGGASYFGGLVSSNSRFYASGGGGGFWAGASDLTLGFYDAAGAMVFRTSGINQLTLAATTGAATFAGTVTGNGTFSSGVLSTTAGGYKLFDAGGYAVNFRPTAARTYVIEGDSSGNDYLTSFTNAGAGKHNLAASGTLSITGAATFAGAVTHTLGTNYPPQTTPAAPASGWVLYTDSGDGNKLKAKASTGTVVPIGTP